MLPRLRVRFSHAVTVVSAGLLTVCSLPAAQALTPPPGFQAAVRVKEIDKRPCADPPPFTGALDFPSKYQGSDKARATLNKSAEAEYKKRIAPISTLEKTVSYQIDDYLRGGQPAALDCAMQLLVSWSTQQALLGPALSHTGMSMRKWSLASLASSYLRLKDAPSQPLASYAAVTPGIEAWLGTLADKVVAEWGDPPLKKMNNHEYWSGWAVMATAHVLQRQDLYDWAMQQFHVAMTQIDAEGFLPNELSREARALHYHNYALVPLSMLAAFAKANGDPPSPAEHAALARLARQTLAGTQDPAAFERKTGDKQIDAEPDRSTLIWLAPYCWTVQCDAPVNAKLASFSPLKHYRLGGDLKVLFPQP